MSNFCVECVKVDALKRYIVQHGTKVNRCNVCGAENTMHIACDQSEFKSKFRALLRYFFSETDYNTHLGGERLELLLARENNITNYRAGWSDEENESALMTIIDPAYEEYDRGISLFAGYSDGEQNLHLIALRREYHDGLRAIRLAASRLNHFVLDHQLIDLIRPMVARITRIEGRGLSLYRARVGYEAKAFPIFGWLEERHFRPYEGGKLGPPRPPIAAAGRMNRSGVSFFYAATDAATALAEIRPHPGHYCSIGKFVAERQLRVADLSALDVTDFATSDKELDDFLLLRTIDEAFSIPVIPEERSEYHFPQLLADAFRHLGFDGVCYRSSVGSGKNYAFFDPSVFTYEARSALVQRIDTVTYASTPMRTMEEDNNRYMTRSDGSFV